MIELGIDVLWAEMTLELKKECSFLLNSGGNISKNDMPMVFSQWKKKTQTLNSWLTIPVDLLSSLFLILSRLVFDILNPIQPRQQEWI